MQGPVLLHVLTKKGKGYAPAEENPALFHGIGQFDPVTGVPSTDGGGPVFSDVFGKTLCSLAQTEPRLCAITAAMCYGTGLEGFARQVARSGILMSALPRGTPSAMAGGLAKQGMIPVVAVYSTFLQRAYDMLLQDVAMQRLHVVFAVDRAGLVGRGRGDAPGHFRRGVSADGPWDDGVVPRQRARAGADAEPGHLSDGRAGGRALPPGRRRRVYRRVPGPGPAGRGGT